MELSGWGYLAAFLGGLSLSLVLTPLALRLAIRLQVLDHPGGHKGHASPVPYLGGAAIVIAFSIGVSVASFVQPPGAGRRELVVILGLAACLAVVGLVDDLRALPAALRLGCQVAAAIVLLALEGGVSVSGAAPLDALITVAWIVGITNAFNLLDNMDGLSAGVAAICSGWFFVIAAINGQFLVAGLAIALSGCALGFLRHNFYPARIYMGDAGSLFIGFLLAVLGIRLRFDVPQEVVLVIPPLVLGVAIFDTALVTTSRLRRRLSPLVGGRDHVSHRLVRVGIPVPAAVALIYFAAFVMGWVALIISRVDRGTAALLVGLVATVAVFFAVLLSAVPINDDQHMGRASAEARKEGSDSSVENS